MRNFVLLLMVISVVSCMRDDELWQRRPDQVPEIHDNYSGVFILNEGNFMSENASISYYNFDSAQVHNNLFFNANGSHLGDVAQSMRIHKGFGYVVVNNSGKIQIIDIEDFGLAGKITNLTSPRYIEFINDDKAYVTDLYAKKISIINPMSQSIEGNINLDNGTGNFFQHSSEQILLWENKAIVNCWSQDNQILILDTRNDSILDSVRVAKQPNSIVLDKNNYLWVLSDGGFQGSSYGQTNGALQCIDLETKSIIFNLEFPIADSPGNLIINGTKDTLYYINKHVYLMPIESNTPELFLAGNNGQIFSSIGLHPTKSEIYVGDAINYTQPGKVFRYRTDGTLVDQFNVGIIPTQFIFY